MNPSGPSFTAPGDYNYTLTATVPGWAAIVASPLFNSRIGVMVNYLNQLIMGAFSYAGSGGANPLIDMNSNDNWVTMDVTFTSALSDADVIVLTNLVNRMADYFIITTDGSTSLGNPASTSKTSGLLSSVAITLVYKQGDGSARTGINDAVSVVTIPTSIDKTSGSMSGGTFTFTFGVQTMKGTISADVMVGQLNPMMLNVTWT